MKAFTSIVVAAALIAPAIAHAGAGSRINTPGTDARHDANLAGTSTAQTRTSAVKAKAEAETANKEARKTRPRAAFAGRVNLAAPSRN